MSDELTGYDPALASERYRALVEQLGEKMQGARGWKARAAELLGVTPGYVSKVLAGKATAVTEATAVKAMRALQIDPAFFTVPGTTPRFEDLQRLGQGIDEEAAGALEQLPSEGWAELEAAAAQLLARNRVLVLMQNGQGWVSEAEVAALARRLLDVVPVQAAFDVVMREARHGAERLAASPARLASLQLVQQIHAFAAAVRVGKAALGARPIRPERE